MMRSIIGLSAAVWILALIPVPAGAQLQTSLCADCHYANGGLPDPVHLQEWESSAHQRHDVGCEACHGGNPATAEAFLAHQSIVRGRGADSPIAPANLPRTCGRCHTAEYVEFQKSRHFALLGGGHADGPTCSTCHGSVAAHLLGPKTLESQCNSCHGKGQSGERLEYAVNARIMLSGVREARDLLDDARPIIARVKDAGLRTSLQREYEQAEVPLAEAVHAAHAFVFVNAAERLDLARARASALLERLANTRSSP